MNERSDLRIGDAEREAAVHALGDHFAEGRLTKDEYDERSSRAYASRTNAELWPLFTDLPRPQGNPRVQRPEPVRHPGWRFGGWAVPLLVVIGVLTLITHLPAIFMLVLAWFVAIRLLGHFRRRRTPPHAHGRDRSSRGSWA